MDENIISLIAKELNISISQVKNTLELLEEGATVPFIARYRKERTKGLDEEQIRVIQENYAYQVNLAKRKEEVLARIETLGKLDDEIIKNVNACTKLSQVEDIYRPYKQKKKTRASVARLIIICTGAFGTTRFLFLSVFLSSPILKSSFPDRAGERLETPRPVNQIPSIPAVYFLL